MELNIMAVGKTTTLDPSVIWDSVIVGGGPAGYNAALYMIRKGLRPLVILSERGGQVALTNEIDNYLGMDLIHGTDMTEAFHKHVARFDVDILENTAVNSVHKIDNQFELKLSNHEIVKSKTVIIATGGEHRKLNVEGEGEYEGKGVSYCAICDAPFFKDKAVVIVGGGDSAVEAAIDLSKWATHVHVVHRSTFRADQILLDKMFELKNVTYELGSIVTEIKGADDVSSVMIYNKDKDTHEKRNVGGIFIEIGQDPRSDLVKDLVKCNSQGEIIVNAHKETSLSGLYAAGDVTNAPFKQIITAAADGAIAALSASQYIMKDEEK